MTETLKQWEIEFIEILATEKSYVVISEEIFLSIGAVQARIARISDKLNVKGRLGIVVFAFRNNLIE